MPCCQYYVHAHIDSVYQDDKSYIFMFIHENTCIYQYIEVKTISRSNITNIVQLYISHHHLLISQQVLSTQIHHDVFLVAICTFY